MSTARFNTLQNAAGSKSVPVDTVVDGSAKAWVNFNGTGTVAIRAAFNVSSITDNSTGDYTINFTTAMTNTSYVVAGMCKQTDTIAAKAAAVAFDDSGTNLTTSGCRVLVTGGSNTLFVDVDLVTVVFFQ